MHQAEQLRSLIDLLPASTEGTTIRKVLLLISRAQYFPNNDTALVDVWYGSPPELECEYITFNEYWNEVIAILNTAQRLGEKVKAVFGFEHALHTYYNLKMSKLDQGKYKGLYRRIVTDLRNLMTAIVGDAHALEILGDLRYMIMLFRPSDKCFIHLNAREERNFKVLEDKLFLDLQQVRKLRHFFWTEAANKSEPYIVKLTGLIFQPMKENQPKAE